MIDHRLLRMFDDSFQYFLHGIVEQALKTVVNRRFVKLLQESIEFQRNSCKFQPLTGSAIILHSQCQNQYDPPRNEPIYPFLVA